MDMMFEPIRKYAQFSGRARRKEYWMFCLLIIGIEIVFYTLMGILGAGPMMAGDPTVGVNPAAGLLMLVFSVVMLGLFIPSLAVSFRRLHDTNRSAWWLLIALIPLLGVVVLLVFMLLDGTQGDNRFGPDPKAREGLAAA
ncbi:DUF805 domain-containing protein [Phenylobacterium sp. LH3H17]|uniref:DUF805 domain-containing protein n=1 Tax=Phenylobacterium sp. LH3H17 TaxID=2903901 RepID=UPI0020C93ED1|nr:DUF805 domain-containing protein [Phenylobacterium sp. LH3H17]UTP39125.1 DUF805 domain-containing protein [Phenylobacterium sp. LH3H17]